MDTLLLTALGPPDQSTVCSASLSCCLQAAKVTVVRKGDRVYPTSVEDMLKSLLMSSLGSPFIQSTVLEGEIFSARALNVRCLYHREQPSSIPPLPPSTEVGPRRTLLDSPKLCMPFQPSSPLWLSASPACPSYV